jgi:hypothetical protein
VLGLQACPTIPSFTFLTFTPSSKFLLIWPQHIFLWPCYKN